MQWLSSERVLILMTHKAQSMCIQLLQKIKQNDLSRGRSSCFRTHQFYILQSTVYLSLDCFNQQRLSKQLFYVLQITTEAIQIIEYLERNFNDNLPGQRTGYACDFWKVIWKHNIGCNLSQLSFMVRYLKRSTWFTLHIFLQMCMPFLIKRRLRFEKKSSEAVWTKII